VVVTTNIDIGERVLNVSNFN